MTHNICTVYVCMGIVYKFRERNEIGYYWEGDIEPKSIFLFASVIDVC